jgi:hypothetical protein
MTMKMTRLLGMMALVCLLAFQLAGCATMKMSSKQLCESSGGMYSGGACNPGKSMKADQMCMAAGGVYRAGEDTCEMGGPGH